MLLGPMLADRDAQLVPFQPGAAMLLGLLYGSYLQTPERSNRWLQAAAAVAERVPAYQLRTSADASPARLADVVLTGLGEQPRR